MSTSFGSTLSPGRTRCSPSTISRSVGLQHFDLLHRVGRRPAGLGDPAGAIDLAQAAVHLPDLHDSILDLVLVVDDQHEPLPLVGADGPVADQQRPVRGC